MMILHAWLIKSTTEEDLRVRKHWQNYGLKSPIAHSSLPLTAEKTRTEIQPQ